MSVMKKTLLMMMMPLVSRAHTVSMAEKLQRGARAPHRVVHRIAHAVCRNTFMG